jgi:hypothetical protein
MSSATGPRTTIFDWSLECDESRRSAFNLVEGGLETCGQWSVESSGNQRRTQTVGETDVRWRSCEMRT